jgi:hypothetical protein
MSLARERWWWIPRVGRPNCPIDAIRRPDTAERQRRIHAAAEHDAWFRAEVRKAIKVADDPTTEWVPNEEAKRQSAIRRIEWLKKAALQEAVV